MKKIFSVLLCTTMLMCSATGCGVDDNLSVDSTFEQSQSIEYETIEPPDDGWTLEKLNDVLYINDKQITIPFSLDDLGEEFKLSDSAHFNEQHDEIKGLIEYQGDIVGAGTVLTENLADVRSKHLSLFAIKPYEVTYDSIIQINGAKLNDSYQELKEKMGFPSEEQVDGITKYAYYNCNDYKIGFQISYEEEKVSSIRIEESIN